VPLPFIIKVSYSLKTLKLLLSFFYFFSSQHFHLKDYSKCSMSLSLADELCKIISKAQLLYVKKRLANAVQKNTTDFFNAILINNKELSLNILLYVSIRYTCYCSIMLLLWNCIIVFHMVLELSCLYCYDLYWPLNNFNGPQDLFAPLLS